MIIGWVAFYPGYVRPAGQGRFTPPADPSLEFLISKLRATRPDWWGWTLAEFIERRNDPEVIDALRIASHAPDNAVSAHANIILFKIRDNPEFRLEVLINEINDNTDNYNADSMLEYFLGPEDIEYLPILMSYLSSDNSRLADTVNEAIKHIRDTSKAFDEMPRWQQLMHEPD